MMLAMQYKKTDMLMFYDAKYVSLSAYGGFFDINTCDPSCVYYAFKAFGELYALGAQAELERDSDSDIYAVAATDGSRRALMISNISAEDKQISTNLEGEYKAYLVDKDNLLTSIDLSVTDFTLAPETVILIKNY
jgi:hypothetical protein